MKIKIGYARFKNNGNDGYCEIKSIKTDGTVEVVLDRFGVKEISQTHMRFLEFISEDEFKTHEILNK
jgi:hypothetical protein